MSREHAPITEDLIKRVEDFKKLRGLRDILKGHLEVLSEGSEFHAAERHDLFMSIMGRSFMSDVMREPVCVGFEEVFAGYFNDIALPAVKRMIEVSIRSVESRMEEV